MTNIYEQHDAAFKQVSAFVIAKAGERVATIAFKFPKDGAGTLYAYVHWIGVPMVRGFAKGYGYDKKSAAVESAILKLLASFKGEVPADCEPFIKSVEYIGGNTFDRALRDAGFTVMQAV